MPFNHMRALRAELISQLVILAALLVLAVAAITDILGAGRILCLAGLIWSALTGA
ncbi:MAG: hypothetical protein AAF503_02615 [Pseudomonadota bacterium]